MRIEPSSNSANIKDIVLGKSSFSFSPKDLNPTLTVDIIQPKRLFTLNVIKPKNILDYDIKLIYKNGKIESILVSYMFFVFGKISLLYIFIILF